MAKLCNIVKNARRMKLADQYREVRTELRAIIKSPNASDEEKDKAYEKLRKLPRDANPNRYKNRCKLTGRPRAYHRKFNISRNMLRKLALEGEIPGMKKSSW